MNGDVAVLAALATNAPVAAFVGGTGIGTARIFLSDAKQGAALPYIIIDQYDSEPFDTTSGVSTVDHDLVKVFVYAETSRSAIDLAELCRDALDGQSGTYNGRVVKYMRYLRNDGYNVDLINRKAYVREHDYQVRIVN